MAEVVLVRWPEDGAEGARLAEQGVAVLYLVGANDDPPMPMTCLEDWVRLPGDDRDLHARVAVLEFRAAAHDSPPHVDRQGRLHYRGRVLALSPNEAKLAEVLVEHFGAVVTDRELSSAEGADTMAESSSLRTHMTHLRSRLREMGLSVHRIRRRGYLLERQ